MAAPKWIVTASRSGGSGGWLLATVCAGFVPVPALAGGTPLDVVLAVDTSGSMDAEVAEVRTGLNAFASAMQARGYDPRLVLVADAASSGLCVPAPLGSGQCPADSNPPGYVRISNAVGSNDALQQLLNTYASYQSYLRAGSLRWVMVVSDDESGLGASAFTSGLLAQDPAFQGFRFHAIAASAPPFDFTSPCFGISAARGAVYQQLVAQTDGVFYDLCLQDLDPAWARIAALDNSLFRNGFENP